MSKGYVVQTGMSRDIVWNENQQFTNTGIALQTLVTINLPAGLFAKYGESLTVDFYGTIVNTLGETFVMVTFDGNDAGGTNNFSVPLSANTRSFHIRSVITAIPNDNFTQNGFLLVSDTTTGSTFSNVLNQNAGGNAIEDAHQILFRCEGQGATVAMNVTVDNFRILFHDSNSQNLFP